jgi:hypothetical protein
MHVKGFILEDDKGREFVMGCERPYRQMGRTYVLRGWQRRRLVPVRYSDQELRQITRDVLIALGDLFNSGLQMGNTGTVELHPTNDAMQPIMEQPADTFQTENIAGGVLRHLKK